MNPEKYQVMNVNYSVHGDRICDLPKPWHVTAPVDSEDGFWSFSSHPEAMQKLRELGWKK